MSSHRIRSRSLLASLPLVLASILPGLLLLGGCRGESPDDGRPADTVARQTPPTTPQRTDSVPQQPAPGRAQAPLQSEWTAPKAGPEITQAKRDVVDSLTGFFSVIDAGNEAAFQRMLSTRSREFLRSMGAEREVWAIAQAALGSIRDRKISILGGSNDSVGLRVEGTRRVDDALVPTSIVMSLLREEGAWRVMYPGAQPTDEHVGP